VCNKGDGRGESFILKRIASSLKEVGGGSGKVNDILVKTSFYITIISIITTSLLECLLIKVTAEVNKSALIVIGRRGKGASP